MKIPFATFTALALPIASLAGCNGAISVVSSDGTAQIGFCDGIAVIDCMTKVCPAGFRRVRDTEKFGGDTIARCVGDGGTQ